MAYLDLVGSGNETSAHTLENERITFMFCAFEGPPLILRLYGKGRAILAGVSNLAAVRPAFYLARQATRFLWRILNSSGNLVRVRGAVVRLYRRTHHFGRMGCQKGRGRPARLHPGKKCREFGRVENGLLGRAVHPLNHLKTIGIRILLINRNRIVPVHPRPTFNGRNDGRVSANGRNALHPTNELAADDAFVDE